MLLERNDVWLLTDWLPNDSIEATAARALIGFLAGWALFKIGKKRFLKRGNALDALIVITIGAVLGRGIAEGESFYGTLVAAGVMMAAHWLLALIAYQHPRLSRMIEGCERPLIVDGVADRRQMRIALVSDQDIVQALRLRTGDEDLSRIEAAWQERNGEISLRLKPSDAP